MSDVKAKIEIEAGTSRLPAALRQGLGYIKNFAENVGKTGASIVKSTALGFVHGVGMSVANRGLDFMIEQGKEVIDFQRELTRLGIDLDKQPAEMQQIGQAIRGISNEVGLGADKVLAAGRDYADLAGLQAFTMERMSLIARSAQASGSDVKDMAALMFTLTENMKVPDNQLEDTIGGLIEQAKFGSIHFKELAKELVALGAVYTQYGITGREGAIQMGAQMQLARHGFSSASEAATGVLRIYRSLPQHASKFAQAGVNIWKQGSKTVMRPFEDIIHQIQKSPLALDRERLIKSFGRTEGERFYQVLTALTQKYDEMKRAGEANGVVQRDLATYTNSAAGRIDVAMERIKNGFAEALTPERIDQIVGGIEQIVGAMPRIVGAITDVMDAFSGMVLYFRKAGEGLRGFGYYPLNKLAAAQMGLLPKISKETVAGYEEEIAMMLKQESPTGPTMESIEHAVRNSMMDPSTPGKRGGMEAGQDYLKERNVPKYVIERARQQIERKETAASIARLAAREASQDPTMAAYDRLAASDEFARNMSEAVKDGVMMAMQRIPTFGNPIPAIRINGDNVGVALDNASRYRKR